MRTEEPSVSCSHWHTHLNVGDPQLLLTVGAWCPRLGPQQDKRGFNAGLGRGWKGHVAGLRMGRWVRGVGRWCLVPHCIQSASCTVCRGFVKLDHFSKGKPSYWIRKTFLRRSSNSLIDQWPWCPGITRSSARSQAWKSINITLSRLIRPGLQQTNVAQFEKWNRTLKTLHHPRGQMHPRGWRGENALNWTVAYRERACLLPHFISSSYVSHTSSCPSEVKVSVTCSYMKQDTSALNECVVYEEQPRNHCQYSRRGSGRHKHRLSLIVTRETSGSKTGSVTRNSREHGNEEIRLRIYCTIRHQFETQGI